MLMDSSTNQENRDLLLRLPAELAALVFSLLSPAALDAARCVCRAWRIKIMSDTWVLSSFLESKESGVAIGLSEREAARTLHRSLSKKLDQESALVATFEHPDTWRTRFRECKIEFHMPRRQDPHHPYTYSGISAFTSVKMNETENFVAFMIEEKPSTDRVCTLLFYRLGLSGQPIYVGSTPYQRSGIQSPGTGIQHMVMNCLSRAWFTKLKIGCKIASYLVTSFEAFTKNDDEYRLLQLGYSSPERPLLAVSDGDDKQLIDTITKTTNSVCRLWVFLACLSNTVVSVGPSNQIQDQLNLINRYMMFALRRTHGAPESL